MLLIDPAMSKIIFPHTHDLGWKLQKDKRTMKPKIWMYKDKETGNMKGEATVTYEDANAAQSAIGWFGNKEFNGSVIKVSLAQRYNTWQNKGGNRGGFNKGGFGGRKCLVGNKEQGRRFKSK